jgi:hypothetical protein
VTGRSPSWNAAARTKQLVPAYEGCQNCAIINLILLNANCRPAKTELRLTKQPWHETRLARAMIGVGDFKLFRGDGCPSPRNRTIESRKARDKDQWIIVRGAT